jgi:hypothetical protein
MLSSFCCDCGCNGQCTLAAVFRVLRWSLEAGARGVFPTARHDGEAFRENEGWRSDVAGQALGFRLALTEIRGDWAEPGPKSGGVAVPGATSWVA